MRLRRGSSVERGQPGRTPQAETETTTRSHRRSAATRSEERDRVRRRHLGDKLLHDVREDRVVFYGSMYDSLQEITYDVRVTAAGEFTVPAILAESMYQLDVKAVAAPSRFTVAPNK